MDFLLKEKKTELMISGFGIKKSKQGMGKNQIRNADKKG